MDGWVYIYLCVCVCVLTPPARHEVGHTQSGVGISLGGGDVCPGTDVPRRTHLTYLCDKKSDNTYYAVKQEAVISFTDFNSTDGTINVSIAFCGTPVEGTTSVSNGTFTFTAASSSSLGG